MPSYLLAFMIDCRVVIITGMRGFDGVRGRRSRLIVVFLNLSCVAPESFIGMLTRAKLIVPFHKAFME